MTTPSADARGTGATAHHLIGPILSLAAIAAVVVLILRGDNYQLFVIALVGLTAIVGIGLNVLLGLTGQISLGHAAFYAIGAYAVGILTTRLGLSFWLALPLAGAIAGLAGMLLAIPALKVRGPYLAMITIAFGFVVEQLAAEWRDLTGGWNGLMGIEAPAVAGYSFNERDIALFVLALTLLATWAFARLGASPWGQAMRAIRDAEVAGQSIGLDPVRVRTAAFGLSAVAAGIAGGIFASMSNFISPESFPFSQSILFLLVVMVGGADRLLGPILGAVVVVLLPEVLSSLAEYRLLFVGVLLLVVLRVAPEGLVGLVQRLLPSRALARTAEATIDVPAFLARAGRPRELTVTGLSINFGGVKAVTALDFKAKPHAVTSVIGPNGAGKSTVLNMICGFYKPDAGEVRLDGQAITGLASHAVAKAGIARTYQTTQLFANMTVLDNVLIAAQRGHLPISQMFMPERDGDKRAIAESLLAFVGYAGDMDRPAGSLPHVDKRLVEIARALALAPSVLALDEPAAGLDEADTRKLGVLLRRIADAGMTVVLVEHDMDLVMSISDHVVVLDAGQKIAEGAPAAVSRDPKVLQAYLGEERPSERGRAVAFASGGEPVLAAKGLSSGYNGVGVISGINLEVRPGEMVAVLGANGAGKSTLMRALSGLNRPVEGEVLLLGARVERFSASRIAGEGLVLVPEGRQVFPELSVVDNIRLGAFARPDTDTEAMVARMLQRFPRLAERRNQRAGLLSGGEQQMLAIARGLMARPSVLMLDEPSLGLAPKLVEQLFDLLAELRDEGMTLLLVDQMAAMALSVADRAYLLQSGRIVGEGTAGQLKSDPELAKTYLGGHG